MLLAVALCVLTDVACRLFLPQSSYEKLNETARAYVVEQPAPDVQILGDSVAQRGIVASALGTRDRVYVRNDALGGSRPPFSYYLLRDEIKAGRVPSVLVLAHSPYSFDAPFVARMAATFLRWRELPELYATTNHKAKALYGTLARLSYLLLNRDSFRGLLTRGDYAFFVTPSSVHVFAPASDIELTRLENYVSEISAQAETATFGFQDVPERLTRGFAVDPETDAYFRRLLALARAHGIKVFWLTLPQPRSVWVAMRSTTYEHDLLAYLGQFEASGDMTILQDTVRVYEDATFNDVLHPAPPGAAEFSCELRRFAPVLARAVQDAGKRAQRDGTPAAASRRAAALARQERTREVLGTLCAPPDPPPPVVISKVVSQVP